jgi:Spy/CpxP family protein refolding chaperone
MRKLIFLPAAVLAAAMLSTAVSAQPGADDAGGPPAHAWHHREGGEMMHMLKDLNLSAEQKASVKQLLQASRAEHKAEFQSFMAAHQAFDSATPGTADYQSAAASLSQAASTAAAARVQQGAELRAQVYALLTDAQKAQWATLVAQHQARFAAWKAQHPQAE